MAVALTKAWLIDSAHACISPHEFEGSEGIHKAVGGYIEIAAMLPDGDVIFVDDEALFKPQSHFFKIAGRDQPLGGNGLCVGREIETRTSWYNAPPSITAEALAARITFLTRDQAMAWAKANASEPAFSIRTIDRAGVASPEQVLQRFGTLFAAIPPVPDKK